MHYTVKFKNYLFKEQGFPDNSAGQESACNARDSGSIPGSRRSAGDGIGNTLQVFLGFPCGSDGKEFACNAGDPGSSLGPEDPLEEGMAILSRILAWRISWTEEPGGLQSTGLHRV